MSMTSKRWEFIGSYAREIFGDPDPQMASLMERAADAGLPQIAVSPDVGRLLKILISLTPGNLAVELGTLGGYSGIWIARGLAPGGKLVTIEPDPRHAEFASREFAEAGVSDKVEIVELPALEAIPGLADRFGPKSVDFVFIDAIKSEYVDYFEALRPIVSVGGVVVADNVYGTGSGWIDEGGGTDDFNRRVATDPDFEATVTPMREGLLIARRFR